MQGDAGRSELKQRLLVVTSRLEASTRSGSSSRSRGRRSLAVATNAPALAFVALHRSAFDPGGNEMGMAEVADLEAADDARREERPEALERAAERAAAEEREALAEAAEAEESNVQEEYGEEAQADIVLVDDSVCPL
eukprot:CAMPEP_0119098078 /NCGR_PEP_ID=MMETSP1178-20130426/184404_1 /TAXON_ID=33656 /ORGANISM="unid sp, Strain CCMP2000" /LENGTH=136 /DNA_ID=CAMNT_0007082047 /DNA_START=693 /DNA_END=1104 /DNA_ORIENTATION=-